MADEDGGPEEVEATRSTTPLSCSQPRGCHGGALRRPQEGGEVHDLASPVRPPLVLVNLEPKAAACPAQLSGDHPAEGGCYSHHRSTWNTKPRRCPRPTCWGAAPTGRGSVESGSAGALPHERPFRALPRMRPTRFLRRTDPDYVAITVHRRVRCSLNNPAKRPEPSASGTRLRSEADWQGAKRTTTLRPRFASELRVSRTAGDCKLEPYIPKNPRDHMSAARPGAQGLELGRQPRVRLVDTSRSGIRSGRSASASLVGSAFSKPPSSLPPTKRAIGRFERGDQIWSVELWVARLVVVGGHARAEHREVGERLLDLQKSRRTDGLPHGLGPAFRLAPPFPVPPLFMVPRALDSLREASLNNNQDPLDSEI
jgi:hypothetical protein